MTTLFLICAALGGGVLVVQLALGLLAAIPLAIIAGLAPSERRDACISPFPAIARVPER